jgi:sulfide dehydrogenase cytochrome subunit
VIGAIVIEGDGVVPPPSRFRNAGMKATGAVVAAMIILSTGSAKAAEAPIGAVQCSGCHANAARAETPVPPLKGRAAAEIAEATIAYKSGGRQGTIMDRIAKGFSDEEIRAIAAWYAEQK